MIMNTMYEWKNYIFLKNNYLILESLIKF